MNNQENQNKCVSVQLHEERPRTIFINNIIDIQDLKVIVIGREKVKKYLVYHNSEITIKDTHVPTNMTIDNSRCLRDSKETTDDCECKSFFSYRLYNLKAFVRFLSKLSW
jgi:hypothetical protein